MKRFGFLVAMMFVTSLLFTGCGNSSNGVADTVNDGDTQPIVVIPDGDNDDSGDTVAGTSVISFYDGTAIRVGSVFDPLLDVTAVDVNGNDITDRIEIVSNNVDTSKAGVYTVVYSVKDSATIIVGKVASLAESTTDVAETTTIVTRTVTVVALDPDVIPPETSTAINGTALFCDTIDTSSSTDANEYNASQPFKTATSSAVADLDSRKLLTSHNTVARLSMVMSETNTTGGEVSSTMYHPILMSYLEQRDDPYLNFEPMLGDGSADIGDPNNPDRVMTALSRDNGKTWKRQFVSYSTEQPKSSKEVVWNNETIEYPGDAQKPDMAVSGNNVLIAWNDKYCPSGNPFELTSVYDAENNKTTWPTDIFGINGTQGSIDYSIDENGQPLDMTEPNSPNGKYVYEVPFSCVWTARGVINDTTGDITWYAPRQLTAGVRDSNHITIAASEAGFALVWQEDKLGLKSGEGAGPGEGWSGSTTNRGSDIWYTSIKMTDFATESGETNDTKLVPSVNFNYPVRITDNELCQPGDSKQYCDFFCNTYGDVNMTQGNESESPITRCLTYDTDMLLTTDMSLTTGTISVLDGDTGASRPALKILKTDQNEHVVVLGYEETKALTVKITGEGDVDQGTIPTDIEVEGKSIYFESFNFNAIDTFDESNISTIQETAMPIISAGNIINVRVPDENETSDAMIYENVRRLVIGTHIDSCDAGDITFAILYKQSFETRGQSSDMFVRVNKGFTFDDFTPLEDGYGKVHTVTNVSAQAPTSALIPEDYNESVSWTPDNLDDYTYENKSENTFSPRIFLRGNNIYVGFEYTPYDPLNGELQDVEADIPKFPNNFHTNIYKNGAWTGPKNITKVIDSSKNTVDARFFTTPKGSADNVAKGVLSDASNPDVLFVTWGTTLQVPVTYDANLTLSDGITPIPVMIEEDFGDENTTTKEADLFFVRSTDNGDTWEEEQNLSSVARTTIQEKEVGSFASPDGKHIYNVWLQQSVLEPTDDVVVTGLDSWFGHVDYNISTAP